MTFCGLILASGKSSRFGFPKALFELDGKSLATRWIQSFEEAGISNIYLTVASSLKDRLVDHLQGRQVTQPILIEFESFEHPQGYSFVHSVRQVLAGPHFDWLVFSPVDVLAPKPQDLLALLNKSNSQMALKPYDSIEAKGGHPVLLSRALCEKFSQEAPEEFRLDLHLRELGDQVGLFETKVTSFFTNMNHQPLP